LLDSRAEKNIGIKLSLGGREMRIEYLLEDLGASCRVRETQEFPVPFPFNWLIAWIHKTGKRTGASNLEQLQRLLAKGG
jgi:hypothetical protein